MSSTKECPSCGAEIPAVSFKCEYCNFEIKTDQSESLNIIKELQNKLDAFRPRITYRVFHETVGIRASKFSDSDLQK